MFSQGKLSSLWEKLEVKVELVSLKPKSLKCQLAQIESYKSSTSYPNKKWHACNTYSFQLHNWLITRHISRQAKASATTDESWKDEYPNQEVKSKNTMVKPQINYTRQFRWTQSQKMHMLRHESEVKMLSYQWKERGGNGVSCKNKEWLACDSAQNRCKNSTMIER